jgi:hypothetical protein
MTFKLRLVILLALSLLLTSCQEESGERGAWVPAIEQTGFEYLSESAARVEAALQNGREKLLAGEKEEALTSFDDADDATQVLIYYDIPMTEARQLIYDAARLHALQRQQEALAHLNRSSEILLKIEQLGSPQVQSAMQELRSMASELKLLLEEEQAASTAGAQAKVSKAVAAKFYELGHKINLLALKSDQVLSGTGIGGGLKAR